MTSSLFLFLLVNFCLISQMLADACNVTSNPTVSYYVGNEKVNWNNAIKACQVVGASLVSIRNQEKSDEIYKFLSASGIKYSGIYEALWISGNRLQDKVHWYWLAQESILYTNWASSEPNNWQGNEECISLLNNGTASIWNDIACNVKLYPLCEKQICLDHSCINRPVPSTVTCNCNCGRYDRSSHL